MTAWYVICALWWSIWYGHQEHREQKREARR